MPVRRLAIAAAVAASAMTAVGAFAAGADITSETLASGSAPVTTCDANSAAWTISFGTDGDGLASTVTVANIADACETGTLSIALTDAGTLAFAGTKTLSATECPAATCTATIDIPSPLLPSAVDSATVLIEGGQ